jgi:hypothetical protein
MVQILLDLKLVTGNIHLTLITVKIFIYFKRIYIYLKVNQLKNFLEYLFAKALRFCLLVIKRSVIHFEVLVGTCAVY